MLEPVAATAIAESLVERASTAGADAADAVYSGSASTSVQIRLGDLEGVDRSESEQIGLRVFIGQRSATVASSDFSDEALDALVQRVMAMAREAPEDPFAGLAPSELLFRGEPVDLDLIDNEQLDPSALRERALAAEASALAVPGVTNSSGAGATVARSILALVTSGGFSGAHEATSHSCGVAVVAGEGSGMERDHAWRSTRHLDDLDSAEALGRLAGERAAARLNSARPKGGRMPVLFDPRVAGSLLGHLAAAISGSSVARKASFLQERLGEQIFAPEITIVDDPLRPRGLRSRPFDGEGLGVARQAIVTDGVLSSWMAESASARQLGIQPTGHAARSTGGAPGVTPSNFFIEPGRRGREDLLRAFPLALLVTELIGQGVNGVTGDYSRGASGFLVRDGAIAEPVAEVTIASNLMDMFATLEPANDLEFRRGIDSPTILVPEMTVAAG